MGAAIQFFRGVDEPVIPDIKLTRSRDGMTGQAKFAFEEPQALAPETMGDITGNLAGRRARISGTENLRGSLVTIKADVPLSALSDYHTELKSMTQGTGSFTMEFSHYDPVPPPVQRQLVEDHRPANQTS